MIKMGVPKIAVKQKMILANLNPEILDGKEMNKISIPLFQKQKSLFSKKARFLCPL